MLIVNSHQTCINCNNKFIVSSECYDSGWAKCTWCFADYEIIKKNVSISYNYVEIELRRFNFWGDDLKFDVKAKDMFTLGE